MQTTPQRSTSVSNWTAPRQTAAEFTVWPAYERADPNLVDLRDRISVAIYVGAAAISLRPTIAEATALVEALEWAIAHSESEVPA